VAERRRRLFARRAGLALPAWRFRAHMPQDACFNAEREWKVAALLRRLARQLPLAALLLGGCVAAGDGPVPLDQYEVWDRYEAVYVSRYGHDTRALAQLGLGLAFARMAPEVPSWWAFFVEPGLYAAPRCVLYTTEGAYESERVMFTSRDQQRHTYESYPLEVDVEQFESVPYGPDGEWRVVAFARFPEEPKGELLRWEVYK
jgi:hypothetical protein